MHTRLPAKAIFLAIIVAFVAAIYAFLFILSRYYEKAVLTNLTISRQLDDNTLSVINILMQKNDFAEYNVPAVISLFEDSNQQVALSKIRWGVYSVARASAERKKYSSGRIALYGTRLRGKDNTGLYLADHGHYLAVAGDTYLTGDCFLPRLGARKAYIDGKSFKYSKIVNGAVRTSAKELPALSEALLKYISEELLEGSGADDSIAGDQALNNDHIVRSFTESPLRIESGEDIYLANISLEGSVIIHSGTLIRIAKSAKLKHVICLAPTIVVDAEFEGQVQLFAIDSLIVGEGARLRYPSAAVVAGIGRSSAYLLLSEDAVVEGTVLAWAELMDNNNVTVSISREASVYGMVYSRGKTEHQGRITGSLYTDKISLKTRQGYYENHLLDAWIDPMSLEPEFSVANLFEPGSEVSQHKLIQWLN